MFRVIHLFLTWRRVFSLFECLFLRLSSCVSPCWIPETAPPALLWTPTWAGLMASHMSRNRSACCRHMFVLKRKKEKASTSTQLHAMCRGVVRGPFWLKAADISAATLDSRSFVKRPQPCVKARLSICKEHIHQATFKHLSKMLQSHNGFNTLLSAILMIQSRDFP